MTRERIRRAIPAAAFILLLSACAGPPTARERPAEPAATAPAAPEPAPSTAGTAAPSAVPKKAPVLKRGGGFYKDDGPADAIPVDLDAVPEPEPRWEPLHRGAQKPYVVLGKAYVPNTAVTPYRARGVASWYGRKFHGQKTSIGEAYDMFAMTAAHTTLALPSYVRVMNPENGRSVIVRLTDRGPFHEGRLIDLSYAAAYRLGLIDNGSGVVDVEAIVPGTPTGTTYAEVTPPAARERGGSGDDLDALIGRLEKSDKAAAASTGDRGTWLQLGAFGSPDNAESLRSHLARELDWLAEPIRIQAGAGIQRVQVGPYASRAEAERVAERIRGQLGMTPTIVVR